MSNDNTIKDDESDTLTNDDLEKFSNLNNNKSKLSNKLFLTAFSIAIIFGGVFIYKYLNYQKSHVETDNAYITGHIIPVNAKIAGHISDIFVEDNQFIEKGDTLLKLEKQDLEVNINQAKAALEVAKQDLIAANSAYELQKKLSEIDVKQSQSVLIQSKSKL